MLLTSILEIIFLKQKKEKLDIKIAEVGFTFGLINSTDKGTRWDTTERLHIINAVDISNKNTELFAVNAPSWVNFKGDWGITQTLSVSNEMFKPLGKMLDILPNVLAKDIESKIDDCIPKSLRISSGPSGPKSKDSFLGNEFV